jgi:hypothetical protein
METSQPEHKGAFGEAKPKTSASSSSEEVGQFKGKRAKGFDPNPEPTDPEVKKPEPPKLTMVDRAFIKTKDNVYSAYPFDDLKIGQGFFVANDDVKFDNLAYFQKEVVRARNYYSTAEHDENGDEIFEEIHTKTKQTTNGKLDLDSGGNPVLGIHSNLVPKLIYARHFSVHAVNEGDEIGEGVQAPAAGVLVARES